MFIAQRLSGIVSGSVPGGRLRGGWITQTCNPWGFFLGTGRGDILQTSDLRNPQSPTPSFNSEYRDPSMMDAMGIRIHCPRRVHPCARETLEVVLAH